MTTTEDGLHRRCGFSKGGKTDGQHGSQRWVWDQAERGFRDDAQHAFTADKGSDQIKTGLVLVAASAGANNGAISKDRNKAEDIVSCHAVFQTAWTTGIRGDVASEAAFLQARRIRGIEPAFLPHGILKITRDHTRLHHGHAVSDVDFLDPVHACQRERDATLQRHASAHIADTGPARGDGDLALRGESEQRTDLLCASGKHDCLRGVGREPFVGAVDGQHGLFSGDAFRAEKLGKIGEPVGHGMERR